jgi:hypothetical protein
MLPAAFSVERDHGKYFEALWKDQRHGFRGTLLKLVRS